MRLDKFFEIIDSIVPDDRGCMVYTRSQTSDGYARYRDGFTDVRGHRLVLERKLGRRILPGLMALHTCDVDACVNPDHLYEGDHLQNMKDMRDRGRSAAGDRNSKRLYIDRLPRGADHKRPTAALTEQQAIEIIEKLRLGVSRRDLREQYGVGRNVILRIATVNSWKHLPR